MYRTSNVFQNFWAETAPHSILVIEENSGVGYVLISARLIY